MRQRVLFAAAGLVAIGIIAGISLTRTRESEMISTPLPKADGAAEVAPLSLSSGSTIRIRTADFRAELTETGAGRIVRMDSTRNPPEPGPEHPVVLDAEVFQKLLRDLGQLKAAWSARKAGEAAISPDMRSSDPGTIPDESNPEIMIEEIGADNSKRLILQLAPTSAEYEETQKALTPLRLIQ